VTMVQEMLEPNTISAVFQAASNLIAEEATTSYSKASYYTTLGLYVISFPGLYSLVKRSVKASNVKKTYELPGPSADTGAKEMKQIAAEAVREAYLPIIEAAAKQLKQVVAYFRAQNYEIVNAGETISFKGTLSKSSSQAFFLTFCTFIGLGSLALVLSIQFQEIGQNFFWMTLLAPYAGVYYWKNADREETAEVKLEIADDERTVDLVIAAGKEELERFARTMDYCEKGMVRVKGIFEGEEMDAPAVPLVKTTTPVAEEEKAEPVAAAATKEEQQQQQ